MPERIISDFESSFTIGENATKLHHMLQRNLSVKGKILNFLIVVFKELTKATAAISKQHSGAVSNNNTKARPPPAKRPQLSEDSEDHSYFLAHIQENQFGNMISQTLYKLQSYTKLLVTNFLSYTSAHNTKSSK